MNSRAADDDAKAPPVPKPRGWRVFILAGCFASLVLLGWLDYLTGYELGFFVFYSVPVGLAAWYIGRWPAVGVALGATVAWWLADYFNGAKYSARFYYYWNGTVHFLAFLINAVSIAEIKRELDFRHRAEAELKAAREALRTLAVLLPCCPACAKPHQHAPRIGNPEARPPGPLPPELADALCADCRAALQPGDPERQPPGDDDQQRKEETAQKIGFGSAPNLRH